MLSMPPHTIMSAEPAFIALKPMMVVCMPEPHILFTVVHGVFFASPAPKAAWRAGA